MRTLLFIGLLFAVAAVAFTFDQHEGSATWQDVLKAIWYG